MTWLFFALLSTVLDTTVVFIDKYILSNKIRDYRGIPIFIALSGFIAGLLFWICTGFPLLPINIAYLMMLSGAFQLWATVTYFKALSKDDASDLTFLFQFTPVIVLVLSLVFLKEFISLQQYAGFILILVASIVVTLKKKRKSFRLSPGFYLIMLSNLMWAISAVLAKFTLNEATLANVLSYESFGVALGGLALYLLSPETKKSFIATCKETKPKTIALIMGNEFLFIFSKAVRFLAFAMGSVTLVSIITSGTQTFIAILFGLVLTLLFPAVFSEDIRQKTLVKKMAAGVLLILGIILLG